MARPARPGLDVQADRRDNVWQPLQCARASGDPVCLQAGWALLRVQLAKPVLEDEIRAGLGVQPLPETALASASTATSGIWKKSTPSLNNTAIG